MPVVPDLAQTVKVASDHSEYLTNVFGCAENGFCTQNFSNSADQNSAVRNFAKNSSVTSGTRLENLQKSYIP